jgi:hypothetical protein
MTSREHLQKHLQKSVELFGENDPSTLDKAATARHGARRALRPKPADAAISSGLP